MLSSTEGSLATIISVSKSCLPLTTVTPPLICRLTILSDIDGRPTDRFDQDNLIVAAPFQEVRNGMKHPVTIIARKALQDSKKSCDFLLAAGIWISAFNNGLQLIQLIGTVRIGEILELVHD